MITAIPDQRLEKFRGILKGMSRTHLPSGNFPRHDLLRALR